MRIEAIIQRLEQAKDELAREAMEQTGGRGAFDYGRASGMYAGLEMAKNLLVEMYTEKERRTFDM